MLRNWSHVCFTARRYASYVRPSVCLSKVVMTVTGRISLVRINHLHGSWLPLLLSTLPGGLRSTRWWADNPKITRMAGRIQMLTRPRWQVNRIGSGRGDETRCPRRPRLKKMVRLRSTIGAEKTVTEGRLISAVLPRGSLTNAASQLDWVRPG